MFRTLTLCALLSFSCAVAQDSRPTSKPAEPQPEKTLMERLSEQQLGVDFGETTLPDVAEFLYELGKLNVVLSPSCPTDGKVTLAFQGESMKDALDLIAAAFDPKLEWSVHANSIVHLRKAGAPALKTPKLGPDWVAKFGERTINSNFRNTAVEEVTEFMSEVLESPIQLAAELEGMPVTVSLRDAPLAAFFDTLAEQLEATWSYSKGSVRFQPVKK